MRGLGTRAGDLIRFDFGNPRSVERVLRGEGLEMERPVTKMLWGYRQEVRVAWT